ncbi:uncharacterized protein MYCFIDRAFT_201749 [Pseudocercospora fijiensis CIRAD86]|uniref:Uncharacterized protein n=1 Tax=Pseudocercospora fijiensis (strain CIRAD86) TaxID=383855 RepID=N1QC74_PSEFD|nr:uncharacterized protein MYCFIDRAFT_201749 [Pseudocercospora fijiensis CIRAD86]EME89007.1 hypothetical protein MYCFIDRAFT_201749 [Pseudocercospora fijiensis CIRAD86]
MILAMRREEVPVGQPSSTSASTCEQKLPATRMRRRQGNIIRHALHRKTDHHMTRGLESLPFPCHGRANVCLRLRLRLQAFRSAPPRPPPLCRLHSICLLGRCSELERIGSAEPGNGNARIGLGQGASTAYS